MTAEAPLLEVEAASKSYRGVAAVHGAGLTMTAGTIRGLIGPNGAGKTTLLNLVSGYAMPDTGRVRFRGVDITRRRPADRARLGLVRTFQDCRLLEDLSVADNLWLASELKRVRPAGGGGAGATEAAAAYELLATLGLERRLDVAVRDLASGERKAVEVGRALTAGAALLLLDEPFSGLTGQEVDRMVEALRRLRESGTCSVLLVEHNLGAVFELCDEVTAMDQGAVIADGPAAEVRDDGAVQTAFFGGTAPAVAEADDAPPVVVAAPAEPLEAVEPSAPAVLTVRGLHAGYRRTRILHGIDLDVAEGAVVGLIGANGAGKTTLFRSIMGLASVHAGSVEVAGRRLRRLRPDVAVAAGIGFCPQGRNLFPTLTVEDNLHLGARRSQRKDVAALVDRVFGVVPGIATFRRKPAGALSGGQQQLLAIGRALMSDPRVLLLDEPSSGLAVGAIQVVADALRELSRQGLAVVLAEQNLGFATSVCERGYVIDSGLIAAEGSRDILERAWELTTSDELDAHLAIADLVGDDPATVEATHEGAVPPQPVRGAR